MACRRRSDVILFGHPVKYRQPDSIGIHLILTALGPIFFCQVCHLKASLHQLSIKSSLENFHIALGNADCQVAIIKVQVPETVHVLFQGDINHLTTLKSLVGNLIQPSVFVVHRCYLCKAHFHTKITIPRELEKVNPRPSIAGG